MLNALHKTDRKKQANMKVNYDLYALAKICTLTSAF